MKKLTSVYLSPKRFIIKSKAVATAVLALCALSACSYEPSRVCPDKLSVTPSVEWEIQHGQYVKTKPKIQMSTEWNF